ncbi:MAG TPA: type III-A CRISPR-associated protein Csm2 [Methanocorpusculum sp.]|nr:type III-A CRISPR-associated protein Csm2 [Methanocorpusculum sp.]HJK09823.1 type III-A CRISPR-associated protein Csm2 [Methanocorpusculum sp.]HJK18006.1 type III-A CRISPR-associated protein Csm2 [Methanocorpusculum sp.]HJK25955.1 type III-A CRISPR-associated protein Csm2 [Methanocorpusculum sp.]HJK28711.1 type III-A CRISPR-associated protein Csm2 [Methanocorpusculum sp.]
MLDHLKSVLGSKDFSELSYEEIAKQDGIAEKLARQRGALKVTQLRKFFDQVKKIELNLSDKDWTDAVTRDFFMLRPQLAYAKGRDLISQEFFEQMSFCLDKVNASVNKPEAYRRFSSLVEATVAYRKYHGD